MSQKSAATTGTFFDGTLTAAVFRRQNSSEETTCSLFPVPSTWTESEETCKRELESSKALLESIRVCTDY